MRKEGRADASGLRFIQEEKEERERKRVEEKEEREKKKQVRMEELHQSNLKYSRKTQVAISATQ